MTLANESRRAVRLGMAAAGRGDGRLRPGRAAATASTRVHVVGGTGSYEGATGTIAASGELDTTSGATSGTYTGTVRR